MKNLIKILLIVAISQFGIFSYLDRVVLMPSARYTEQTIASGSRISIDPQKISTDHKYYAKLQTTGIQFYTMNNTLEKEVPLKTWENVSYFCWVPDTDLALIGINSNTANGTSVTLKPVNLETNNYPVEPQISGLPQGSKIAGVAFSPQVNVTYILVKSKYTTSVYRTDANNQLRCVISDISTDRIASLQSEDMLLYGNKQNGVVYALSNRGKRQTISPVSGKYTLIGTDKDDNIYIGQLSGSGFVSNILKGNKQGNFSKYKTLDHYYPINSITVNYYGKIKLI